MSASVSWTASRRRTPLAPLDLVVDPEALRDITPLALDTFSSNGALFG